MSDHEVATIEVGDSYPVHVGHGAGAMLEGVLPEGVLRVLLVHPETLTERAVALAERLAAAQPGLQVHREVIPDGEAAKTADVLVSLWSQLGLAGFTRSDLVITLGGGATTDLGGFVAASWLRGIKVIHLPTTLLAMVDAAVGGKTGINTAEGKNLVGAFHEPHAVICDLDELDTLPQADLVAGLAEVIKCGFIADPRILEIIEADPQAAVQGEQLAELVRRAIAVKAQVVAADLTESSLREILNYGHTFGHAIEQVEGYTWRHGDAVAVGMMYAANLALLTGQLSQDEVDRHEQILRSLGLPTSYAGAAGFEALLAAMSRDKKTRGSTLRFVVLDGIGHPTRLVGPDEDTLRRAYQAVS